MSSHPSLHLLSPFYWATRIFNAYYVLVQYIIIWLFKPVRSSQRSYFTWARLTGSKPPPPSPDHPKSPKGRIAVIGAGLTGISSAAHAIAHGFDVVIYEQDDKIGEHVDFLVV